MEHCKGLNCTSTTGENHSTACEKEHDAIVHTGAGNRNPQSRYDGYSGLPVKANANADEVAAYIEGVNAQGT